MNIELTIDLEEGQNPLDGGIKLFLVVEGELQGGYLPDLEAELNAVVKREYHPNFSEALNHAIQEFLNQIPEYHSVEEVSHRSDSDIVFFRVDDEIHSKNYASGLKMVHKRDYLYNLIQNSLLYGDWIKDFKSKRLFVKKSILIDAV